MQIVAALNVFVTFLTVINTVEAQNSEVIESLIQAYSTRPAESTAYFSAHGKRMFEQVSMLDAMALAKRGKPLEARDQLASLALQSILADLAIEYKEAGGLLKLMESDRSLFKETINAVQTNLKTTSEGIKQKLVAFKQSTSKTDEDKRKVQEGDKRQC